MQTASNHHIQVGGQAGRFHYGRFVAGPFKGQRAISNDGGRVWLPAVTPPTNPGFADTFSEIWKDIFSGGMKGGAA